LVFVHDAAVGSDGDEIVAVDAAEEGEVALLKGASVFFFEGGEFVVGHFEFGGALLRGEVFEFFGGLGTRGESAGE